MYSLFPPSHITVESVLERIRVQYPSATIDSNVAAKYSDTIMIMEHGLKLTRVALRAISLPPTMCIKNGRTIIEKGLTFHWACFRGKGENIETYVVSYSPRTKVPPRRNQHILNNKVYRLEYRKQAWQDLHDCFPEGYPLSISYFKPRPDPKTKLSDIWKHQSTVLSMEIMLINSPEVFSKFERSASSLIKRRYKELLNEYHETYNAYHLTRADFYRKLKSKDMSRGHIILCGLAQQGLIEDYFVENMLRTAYTKKIDSL